ncbi:hypothetical protein [Nocardia sp. XZ_19_385]|uniref:hypothetical protein n=1 Tax=Nocardia sp. XZ_19_385 TaxID=2769488 RepID=UPI00188FB5E3|nr:hypothetical protein [Nocardia sp. XZ_19_385]
MSQVRKVVGGPTTLVWMLGVCAGSVLFVLAVTGQGIRIGQHVNADVGPFFGFLGGIVTGLVLWSLLLRVAWRYRREYLRRKGTHSIGSVVDSDYRHTLRSSVVTQREVSIEVLVTHPETGEALQVRKRYCFVEFRARRARALHAEFPTGTPMPVFLRGRYAAFDIPDRPGWLDIW